MLDPAGLYRLEPDAPTLDDPVLVMVLDGFVDAGAAARLAVESLLAAGAAQRVARFDVDQLVDYRSRRPPLRFET
ncbi:MAG TPA: PAC2 family protein, partial [Pseudonocardia sp.]|nr:PAC2 family protein [Pseudonocardia sp.]